MVKIYEIIDCNGLRYVGSTIRTLQQRLSVHKSHKSKSTGYCSSFKLDLDNCQIKLLEECDISVRKERERNYINTLECVNINKLNGRDEEKRSLSRQTYNQKQSTKKTNLDRYYWRVTWGENQRDPNNLLKIDVNLFQ